MEIVTLFFSLLALFVATASSTSCTLPSPPVTYTTTDASVLSAIAYISTFKLNCGSLKGNVYAVEDSTGIIVPVGVTPGGEYQISVVKELPTATTGPHTFSLHTDEGLSLLKKKQPATPLATIVINHPGAYSGPWLNSEHLAAGLGVIVGWAAISGKGKLLS